MCLVNFVGLSRFFMASSGFPYLGMFCKFISPFYILLALFCTLASICFASICAFSITSVKCDGEKPSVVIELV